MEGVIVESDEAKLVRLALLATMFPTDANVTNFKLHLAHCFVLADDLPDTIDGTVILAARDVSIQIDRLQTTVRELQAVWSSRSR
jgi:hypothetical protein